MFTAFFYGKILLWLLVMIFIIVAIAYIFTKIEKNKNFSFMARNFGKIEILEVKNIDFKQKIVMCKRSENYYLFLLSPNGNILVDKFNEEKNAV